MRPAIQKNFMILHNAHRKGTQNKNEEDKQESYNMHMNEQRLLRHFTQLALHSAESLFQPRRLEFESLEVLSLFH